MSAIDHIPPPTRGQSYAATINVNGALCDKKQQIQKIAADLHYPFILALSETQVDDDARRRNPEPLRQLLGDAYTIHFSGSTTEQRQKRERERRLKAIHQNNALTPAQRTALVERVPQHPPPAKENAGVALAGQWRVRVYECDVR